MPTHAPENVLFSLTPSGLEVTWDPLPVYFHGHVLDGYTVEIWKTDNTLLGAYSQAADSSKVTIPGIKEEHRVACVAVNGFTKYGDGPSSGCAFEEHGTLCTSCNLVSRLLAFLSISEGSFAFFDRWSGGTQALEAMRSKDVKYNTKETDLGTFSVKTVLNL